MILQINSLGIMQIYLEQIALFVFFGQCIWSKCPKTHIKNLVESSAGNYAFAYFLSDPD